MIRNERKNGRTLPRPPIQQGWVMTVLSPGCMAGDYVNGGEEEGKRE